MSCEAEARKRVIYRVTFVGFVVNLVLTAMKFAAGIAGRSGAMVADAVHSCSDMLTDIVVIAFAKVSAKPRDDGHDYGHGKYETLATIIISLALAAVGAGILLSSIRAIRIVVDGGELPRPGAVALAAAAVSIVVKAILYRYTVREGRRVESPSMVANAWHHRSDALSSLGTLAGIGCAYFLGQRWRIVHVRVDGAMSVARSHELTVDIERRLRARFGEGTIISIHVEPAKCPSGAEIPGVDPPSCP